MISAKEKAEEIYNRFRFISTHFTKYNKDGSKNTKQCALIAVDEIIDSMSEYDKLIEEDLKSEFGIEFYSSHLQNMDADFRYWSKVKNEIEKL